MDWTKVTVEDVDWPTGATRILNCFHNNDIKTLGDVSKLSQSELLSLRNFGKKSLRSVEAICRIAGLSLSLYPKKTDLLELAWGIIANAGGGNWEKESKEWQNAAMRWRDAYFGSLKKLSEVGSNQPNANHPPNLDS